MVSSSASAALPLTVKSHPYVANKVHLSEIKGNSDQFEIFCTVMKSTALLLSLFLLPAAFGEQLTYYIGVDGEKVLVPFPHADTTYLGLPNPNFGRLTLLYAHWLGPPDFPAFPVQSSHYHPRSAYGYYGPPASADVVSDAGPENELPEAFTGCPGLLLAPGTGSYAGRLTSFKYADTSPKSEGHYSDLTIGSTDSLSTGFSPTSREYWMYRAESSYFTTSLAGSNLVLKLFGITPGLHVDIGSQSDVFASTDTFVVGDGAKLRFTPIFWTSASAAPGDYVASFILSDRNSASTGFKDSGVFHFRFRVPVPAGPMTSLTIVSSADFGGCTVAPSQLVSIFGSGLTSAITPAATAVPQDNLNGVTVTVSDANGAVFPASLYAVSPGQVNAVLPAAIAEGPANVTVRSPAGTFGGTIRVTPSAPSLFSADGTGSGLAAGQILRVKADGTRSVEPIAQFDSAQAKYVPVAVDVSNPAEQVYLTLYGTGFRNIASPGDVVVNVFTATTPPLYIGAVGQYPGLDQMNILLPPSLAGLGQVYVVIAIGDLDNEANLVWLQIK
ncbi:MAG TPA: all3515 family Zur-repressed PEP-CTERM protein [Verrucomicrobiae bacterium]|nr:all3515 family Zur-repressed PEP-CTERM protein [Verrucomicrobiae bacterium]